MRLPIRHGENRRGHPLLRPGRPGEPLALLAGGRPAGAEDGPRAGESPVRSVSRSAAFPTSLLPRHVTLRLGPACSGGTASLLMLPTAM